MKKVKTNLYKKKFFQKEIFLKYLKINFNFFLNNNF